MIPNTISDKKHQRSTKNDDIKNKYTHHQIKSPSNSKIYSSDLFNQIDQIAFKEINGAKKMKEYNEENAESMDMGNIYSINNVRN